MSEPTTEAGKRLLERLGWFASEKGDALREGILAIEAEAVTAALTALRAEVESMHIEAVTKATEYDGIGNGMGAAVWTGRYIELAAVLARIDAALAEVTT